ncbi:MAG: hypothetical protein AAF244_03045 [Pseudomonadota bacterium]
MSCTDIEKARDLYEALDLITMAASPEALEQQLAEFSEAMEKIGNKYSLLDSTGQRSDAQMSKSVEDLIQGIYLSSARKHLLGMEEFIATDVSLNEIEDPNLYFYSLADRKDYVDWFLGQAEEQVDVLDGTGERSSLDMITHLNIVHARACLKAAGILYNSVEFEDYPLEARRGAVEKLMVGLDIDALDDVQQQEAAQIKGAFSSKPLDSSAQISDTLKVTCL